MEDAHAAVERYAGSYMKRFGSSSRSADELKTPPVMGTVTDFPVRSSVIVIVSVIWDPLDSDELCVGAFSPRRQIRRSRVLYSTYVA